MGKRHRKRKGQHKKSKKKKKREKKEICIAELTVENNEAEAGKRVSCGILCWNAIIVTLGMSVSEATSGQGRDPVYRETMDYPERLREKVECLREEGLRRSREIGSWLHTTLSLCLVPCADAFPAPAFFCPTCCLAELASEACMPCTS